MSMNDEDEESLVKNEEVWPRNDEMQRIIKSGLHLFQETTLDRQVEAIVE